MTGLSLRTAGAFAAVGLLLWASGLLHVPREGREAIVAATAVPAAPHQTALRTAAR